MTERKTRRLAGLCGILPAPLYLTALLLPGNIFYPTTNSPGRAYIDYALRNHTGQLQAILIYAIVLSLAGFIFLTATAYYHRAKRLTLPVLMMLGGTTAYVAGMMASLASLLQITLRGHADPTRGGDPVEQALARYAFHGTNLSFGLSTALLAIVLIGVLLANNEDPVIPRRLALSAIPVAIINVAALVAALFIYTGPWSIGSLGAAVMQNLWVPWVLIVAMNFVFARNRRAGAGPARIPTTVPSFPRNPTFRARLLNRLERIHPTVPPLLLCPIVLLLISLAVSRLGPLPVLAFCALGYGVWTLTEYWVHRVVFHFDPKSRWGRRLHWTIHGAHHDQPNDPRWFVMVSMVAAPVAVLTIGAFWLLLGAERGHAAAAGFIAGYVLYDVLHFHLHNNSPSTAVGQWLRDRHLRHHSQDERHGFGVSCPYWDHVFGTAAPQRRKSGHGAFQDQSC